MSLRSLANPFMLTSEFQNGAVQARIHPYFPYFHVDVMALVFVFRPAPGAAIGE